MTDNNRTVQHQKPNGGVSRRGLLARVTGLVSGMAIFGTGCPPNGASQKLSVLNPDNVRNDFRTALIQRITNFRYQSVATDETTNRRYAVPYPAGSQESIWEASRGNDGADLAARDHHDWLFVGDALGMFATPPFMSGNANSGYEDAMDNDVMASGADRIEDHLGIRPNTDESAYLDMIFEGARGLGILKEVPDGQRGPRFPYIWEDVYHVLQYKVNKNAVQNTFRFALAELNDLEEKFVQVAKSSSDQDAMNEALKIVRHKKSQLDGNDEYFRSASKMGETCY